jgi:hypothetical protein
MKTKLFVFSLLSLIVLYGLFSDKLIRSAGKENKREDYIKNKFLSKFKDFIEKE